MESNQPTKWINWWSQLVEEINLWMSWVGWWMEWFPWAAPFIENWKFSNYGVVGYRFPVLPSSIPLPSTNLTFSFSLIKIIELGKKGEGIDGLLGNSIITVHSVIKRFMNLLWRKQQTKTIPSISSSTKKWK